MTEPKQDETKEKQSPNWFQRKYGGIPVWVILVAVGLAVLGIIYWRQKNSQQNTPVDQAPAGTIPPFINQVYTNPTPPSTPHPKSPEGPPGLEKIIDKPSEIFKIGGSAKNWEALAKRFHMTGEQLAELNPKLADRFMNTGHRIPKGTEVRIYKSDVPKKRHRGR
jgi:hypothetical protein